MLRQLEVACASMCRMLTGYGSIALELLSMFPCGPPVLANFFAGLLDSGLEHLPPLSHQLVVW